MTKAEFDVLSKELMVLSGRIPLKWGAVQNNQYDKLINMFSCHTFKTLEDNLAPYDEAIKQYFRRRWYMWKCAQCDEYLFCENDGVISNPNVKDQSWDIEIRGINKFDIKGTVIPKEMRRSSDAIMVDPYLMIKFFYDRQSRGVRYCCQNRLFVVHHSSVESSREFYLRCAWDAKRIAYKDFCVNFDSIRMFSYNGCAAAVIFIVEKEIGKVDYLIPRQC